jgi:two-component system NarL family sensor kinase
LQVDLQVQGQRQRLDPLVETVFFRVAQEALTNVIRHAQCDQASLELSFEPKQVVLSVRDQGVGITTETADSPERGWGLEGMRERVESIKGQLQISSPESGGTLVKVIVPMNSSKNSVTEEMPDEHHPPDVS